MPSTRKKAITFEPYKPKKASDFLLPKESDFVAWLKNQRSQERGSTPEPQKDSTQNDNKKEPARRTPPTKPEFNVVDESGTYRARKRALIGDKTYEPGEALPSEAPEKYRQIDPKYDTGAVGGMFLGAQLGAELGKGEDPMFRLGAVLGGAIAGLFNKDFGEKVKYEKAKKDYDKELEDYNTQTEAELKQERLKVENESRATRAEAAKVRLGISQITLTNMQNEAEVNQLFNNLGVLQMQLSKPDVYFKDATELEAGRFLLAKKLDEYSKATGNSLSSFGDLSTKTVDELISINRIIARDPNSKVTSRNGVFYTTNKYGEEVILTNKEGHVVMDEAWLLDYKKSYLDLVKKEIDEKAITVEEYESAWKKAEQAAIRTGLYVVHHKTKTMSPQTLRFMTEYVKISLAEQKGKRIDELFKDATLEFRTQAGIQTFSSVQVYRDSNKSAQGAVSDKSTGSSTVRPATPDLPPQTGWRVSDPAVNLPELVQKPGSWDSASGDFGVFIGTQYNNFFNSVNFNRISDRDAGGKTERDKFSASMKRLQYATLNSRLSPAKKAALQNLYKGMQNYEDIYVKELPTAIPDVKTEKKEFFKYYDVISARVGAGQPLQDMKKKYEDEYSEVDPKPEKISFDFGQGLSELNDVGSVRLFGKGTDRFWAMKVPDLWSAKFTEEFNKQSEDAKKYRTLVIKDVSGANQVKVYMVATVSDSSGAEKNIWYIGKPEKIKK